MISDSFSEYSEYLTKQRKLSDHKYNIIFFYLCVFSSLNDAIHISKDSGLTMGMAVCFCWYVTAELKLSGMLLVVKHASWTLLPSAGRRLYCNTWPLVSGNFVARKLPAARAPAANRMGMALVMPTNDWKMLIPSTAASLQRAFRKPNAVVLETRREGHTDKNAHTR